MALATLLLVSGCGPRHVIVTPDAVLDTGWTERKLTEKELAFILEENPGLDKRQALEILARLNIRDRDYIQADITRGRRIKVPNDFGYYRAWTPMPSSVPEAAHLPKFVLVVKNIPFIGWYEKGRLKKDTYVCIGKKGEWTKAGLYRVENKDSDHVSQSYTNAYGNPALMPWALRIYGHVWIHAGDIEKANCSHGCINLPIAPAEQLYSWSMIGTVVLVVESLKDLKKAAKSIPSPRQPSSKPPKPTPAPQPAKLIPKSSPS